MRITAGALDSVVNMTRVAGSPLSKRRFRGPSTCLRVMSKIVASSAAFAKTSDSAGDLAEQATPGSVGSLASRTVKKTSGGGGGEVTCEGGGQGEGDDDGDGDGDGEKAQAADSGSDGVGVPMPKLRSALAGLAHAALSRALMLSVCWGARVHPSLAPGEPIDAFFDAWSAAHAEAEFWL